MLKLTFAIVEEATQVNVEEETASPSHEIKRHRYYMYSNFTKASLGVPGEKINKC